ncbi:peptidase M14 [Bremerella cremea]|uniref:Peptidase M14 n=1 Tax=Bremerella cremea TaxID=1031537 RepID=A0A368KWQ5_9BACT|nr:M14 metallopeptidase family protein [Bremerella cremea]RCS54067.1 peptidase M14 [Bremerella cremea]
MSQISRYSIWLILLLMCPIAVGAEKEAKPEEALSPEAFLGRSLGADFCLVDWQTVQGYYTQLSEASPTMQLQRVGETTEGRDFLISVISSPENLKNLEAIKAASQAIADPRGKSVEELDQAIENGKVILFVTPSMHSTEVAATEMGMQLAWLLATSEEAPWSTMRDEAVVVLLPSLNPDGVDHMAKWYAQNLGKPYEDADMPELYQKYAGHDNNRDFFALTQVEARMLSKLMYQQWYPQILWDVHQQGKNGDRFFVPPYRDPLNENIDPMIVAGINTIGSRAVMDMTGEDCTGIVTGVSYDNWWNGGNRSVPARQNIIGILTEAASANFASPVYFERYQLSDPLGRKEYRPSNQFIAPWQGGWWRQADIIRYELSFAKSLFGTISREPKLWLKNKMTAARNATTIDADSKRKAWLITVDNEDIGAVERLVDLLQHLGIEVHQSKSAITADERSYAPGTLVVSCEQPHSNLVNDLFEYKQFPTDETAYDVSGWSLSALFGLRVVEVVRQLDGELELLDSPELPDAFASTKSTDPRQFRDSRQWVSLNRQLAKGEAFQTSVQENAATEEPVASNGQQPNSLPRVGVYAPWAASMDEGWLRWTLDYLEMPYKRVRNSMVKAGKLKDDFDVIIIPDISASRVENGRSEGSVQGNLAGGLEVDGAMAIEEFVRDGGKLIVMDSACPWVIDLLRIPLVDVTSEKENKDFSCSGSVVRGEIHDNELTAGLPDTVPFMFAHSKAWRAATAKESEQRNDAKCEVETLLTYAPRRVLLSGTMARPEVIEGQIAWAKVKQGEGTIHLFGFRPYYRGWTHASFHLLMRSIMFD